MNKQVLSPFDCDMCAMVEDLTGEQITVTAAPDSIRISWAQHGSSGKDKAEGQRIEAIKQAIRGRLGDRVISFEYADDTQSVYFRYDPEQYPEEIRTQLTAIDPNAGQRYCRMLKEVDAVLFTRENLEAVRAFTGGGTIEIPRTPDGLAKYRFTNPVSGLYTDVVENWYIVRETSGKMYPVMKVHFEMDFEPKGIRTVGNYDGKPVRPSALEILNTFNELFGTDIDSRNRKLSEEYGEYMEAANAFIRNPDDRALFDAMIDELADLNAVAFHIAGIVGKSPYDLLQMAFDKVKGRQIDPEYKRTHPHEKKTPQQKAVDVVHGISPGLRYMVDERLEQLFLGRDITHDNKENAAGELLDVAAALVKNDPDYYGRSGWSWEWWEKTTAKPERERLAIAGALIAAEIDREQYNAELYAKEIADNPKSKANESEI